MKTVDVNSLIALTLPQNKSKQKETATAYQSLALVRLSLLNVNSHHISTDGCMRRDKQEESIKIDFVKRKRNAHAFLRVITFVDGDFMIAYIPSLNLSGYGDTEAEALAMMEQVAKDYFAELLKLNEAQVMAELRQYGWQRLPYLAKELRNTEFLSNERIAEDFNLPAGTEFNERYVAA